MEGNEQKNGSSLLGKIKKGGREFVSLFFPRREKLYFYLTLQAFVTGSAIAISIIIGALTGVPTFILLIIFSFPIGFLLFLLVELIGEHGINLALGFSSTPDTKTLLSPYYDKVKMALREEKYEIAIGFLEKIIEMAPKELPAHLEMAKIYHYKLKDYTKALERYKKILNIVGWDEKPDLFYIEAKKGIAEITKELSPREPEA